MFDMIHKFIVLVLIMVVTFMLIRRSIDGKKEFFKLLFMIEIIILFCLIIKFVNNVLVRPVVVV